jgi:FkbM family methyltransferase
MRQSNNKLTQPLNTKAMSNEFTSSEKIKSMLRDFIYQESYMDTKRSEKRLRLFKTLTKDSSNLFLRGRDIISMAPQVIGTHEPLITSLINHFSDVGYADFLFDIGANIGLTSCQNGNKFKQVHMFEPNPYCCKVLEVNSYIALHNTTHQIHKYGLGEENKKCVLTIPRHNWGGAFVKDENNSYDDNILAGKDGFQTLTKSNYFTVNIEIRKTTIALNKIFKELMRKNLTRGVIKIDVEGYEPSILKGIAESIPSEIKILIVFESWDSNFDMYAIVKSFKGRATPYKVVQEIPWKKNWPKVLKGLSLLHNSKITYRVIDNKTHDWSGDLILLVE